MYRAEKLRETADRFEMFAEECELIGRMYREALALLPPEIHRRVHETSDAQLDRQQLGLFSDEE